MSHSMFFHQNPEKPSNFDKKHFLDMMKEKKKDQGELLYAFFLLQITIAIVVWKKSLLNTKTNILSSLKFELRQNGLQNGK